MSRKPLSKKARFEVFKRDSFTCQYCGQKAPDVILHVDHINPVSKGGTNNILNLITSCFECNLGKKDIILDDKTLVNKQRKQSEELQVRREQIEMMSQWQESLKDLSDLAVNKIIDYIKKSIETFSPNIQERNKLSKISNKFALDKIYSAIDKGLVQYILYDADGNPTNESIQNFLSKIEGIIKNSKDPIISEIHYIKGTCKNKFKDTNEIECINLLKNYTQALKGVCFRFCVNSKLPKSNIYQGLC